MQKQIRAAKGGESGINGLWYNGGTFMPATVLPKLTRGSTPANGEEFKQSERKSEGLPVMEAGRKSSLIKELGALLADRLLPEARRPGREMFDAGWLFRNVTPALERGSREFEITKELSKYQ